MTGTVHLVALIDWCSHSQKLRLLVPVYTVVAVAEVSRKSFSPIKQRQTVKGCLGVAVAPAMVKVTGT